MSSKVKCIKCGFDYDNGQCGCWSSISPKEWTFAIGRGFWWMLVLAAVSYAIQWWILALPHSARP